MKIACFTDIHNQQTMLNMPTRLRGSAKQAVAMTKQEWGQADLSIIGGDNISDYPHWNKSCALPYQNWLDIKQKMVDEFASVSKDGRVLYVDGNNDMILGDLPTKDNPPYNTCEFYYSGPMNNTLGTLSEDEYVAKYCASKGEQAGKHLLCFHYVVDGIDFFGINIDPDSAFNSHDGYYDRESLVWLKNKLTQIDPEGDRLIFVVGHLSAATVWGDEKIVESMWEGHRDALYEALSGHKNLFYLYGHVHGQGYVHKAAAFGVLHHGEDKMPLEMPFDTTDSRDIIKGRKVSFNTVHMGGLRPFYATKDGVNLYFEEDADTGMVPGDKEEKLYPSTATPKLAQFMLIETFCDRVEFSFRNTGTFEGFSKDDIQPPYVVWR